MRARVNRCRRRCWGGGRGACGFGAAIGGRRALGQVVRRPLFRQRLEVRRETCRRGGQGFVLGWIGIDPTNNCFANEHHIQLAVGRDFKDCTSVKGTFKGPANQELMVYVSVGYEDGTIFEDENEVQMYTEDTDTVPIIHVQQQQQQQQ